MVNLIINDKDKDYFIKLNKVNNQIIVNGISKEKLEYYISLVKNNEVKINNLIYYDKDDYHKNILNNHAVRVIAVRGVQIVLLSSLAIGLFAYAKSENKSLSDYFNQNYIYVDEDKEVEDITYEDILDKINNSNLNDEEKEYLNNELFINDMLPYVNNSNLKNILLERLDGLNIQEYENEDDYFYLENVAGYYALGNTIYLHKNENDSFRDYRKTLAHEFVHMFQYSYHDNYIIEALAEIMADEYFEDIYYYSYKEEVINVKLLMEFIGPDAVLNFAVSEDINILNDKLRDYLTDEELQEFDDIVLNYGMNRKSENNDNNERMLYLLNRMNVAKTGNPIDQDIITALKSNSFKRVYFNSNEKDLEDNNQYSVYSDYNVSFADGEKNNLIRFYYIKKTTALASAYQNFDASLLTEDINNILVLNNNITIDSCYYSKENDSLDLMIIYYINGNKYVDTFMNLFNQGYLDYRVNTYEKKYVSYEDYQKYKDFSFVEFTDKGYEIKDNYLIYGDIDEKAEIIQYHKTITYKLNPLVSEEKVKTLN